MEEEIEKRKERESIGTAGRSQKGRWEVEKRRTREGSEQTARQKTKLKERFLREINHSPFRFQND